MASLTNQAVFSNGAINKGLANVGTISGFSPIGFDPGVTSDTPRTVTFTITPPSSGYSNSGGSDISCPVNLVQPAVAPTAGNATYYTDGISHHFITLAQAQAAQPSFTLLNQKQICLEGLTDLEGKSDPRKRITQKARIGLALASTTETSLVNTHAFFDRGVTTQLWKTSSTQTSIYNPTGGLYWRIDKVEERGSFIAPLYQVNSHYIKLEPSGLITEVWYIVWGDSTTAATFTKIA